ncbi:hypothetical protein BBK36DRAFT_1171619 [Trichoderma citrinoviride]|uniref:Uncharacterized protein n=1 Tax=Trichoderma citrinoviride TaxID=58853 RepID=A0A2T4B249_9HYPO|nr:hypothetical protein BBK36DRAFT_1171619 [Trichoderma citrinoviride]PTB63380.1 hypothetical protein BBK36DRAFT_1171619 [Trichoderma citrinoviride]
MASNKRTVIEVSSGSDDDNPLVNRRRKIRRRSQPQYNTSDPEEIKDKVAGFRKFIDGALPRSLVACDVADYIQRESNARLAVARQQGVPLEKVFIGRDCLPAWTDMQWDPEQESLHCAIQNRLLDLDVANVLGDTLRGLLIDKGNRKLEEARQLGLRLEDLTIGVGLLATWNRPAPELQNGHGLENPFNEQAQHEELMDDDMGQSSLDTSIPRSLIFSRAGTPEFDTESVAYESSSEEESDDEIRMNNAIDPRPEYSESDDEAPHILHDVEVVGCLEGHLDVDLEVYMVEDDSDVDDLPELELAIDGDAFAYYFGDDGAVEVEIPGMDLRCSLDVPPDMSYEDGDADMEDAYPEEEGDDGEDVNNLFNEDEDMDEQEDGGANTQLNADEVSVVSVAQEDEEHNSGIRITQDGFVW